MKCARATRELLWLTRFGELGPSSQPHLDHLAGCPHCRDEVGFDRAMVQQLRIALAERIDTAQPSPHAWEVILERAQMPEPRGMDAVLHWSGALVARLRIATAMAGTGLAVLLALNMNVLPVAVPGESASEIEASSLLQVPRIPTDRTALVPYMVQSEASAEPARPDPEAALTNARSRASQRTETVVIESPSAIDTPFQLRVVIRLLQTPDPGQADARYEASEDGGTNSTPPVGTVSGEPS